MDDNNWWVVAEPGTIHDNVTIDLKELSHAPVTDGTLIELFHRATGRRLNSHNVAAPLTVTAQEVSGYINYSATFTPHTYWRLRLVDAMRYENLWVPSVASGGGSEFYLEHIGTNNMLLASTGQQLPEWGFFQKEIVTTKLKLHKTTTWSVPHVYYPFLDQIDITKNNHSLGGVTVHSPNTVRMELKRQLDRGVMKKLNFFGKFRELNLLMFMAHGQLTPHSFSSEASQWPLVDKNVPYWLDSQTFKQIHLLGNPFVWWLGVACICIYVLLFAFLLARRHRGVFSDVTEEQWYKISRGGVFLLLGWAFQYFPYFLLHRCLFLHHYLPALTFKIMLSAAVCEYMSYIVKVTGDNILNSLIKLFVYILISTVSLMFFCVFQVLSYGNAEISREDANILSLGKNWEIYYRELF